MRTHLVLRTSNAGLKRYVAAGKWACQQSPTGAHHWVLNGGNVGVCRHCRAQKKYPIIPGEILEAMAAEVRETPNN